MSNEDYREKIEEHRQTIEMEEKNLECHDLIEIK